MADESFGKPAHYLDKAKAALGNPIGAASQNLVFLVLPGSFSPVHSQHLHAMEIARDLIAGSGWHVIAGFLAPSDDDYVRRKTGEEAWSLTRRHELCRIATSDSLWLDVAPFAEFSSYRATLRLQQDLRSKCRQELQGRDVVGIEIMGSDTAVRILERVIREWETGGDDNRAPRYHPERLVCCLVRPGPDAPGQIERLHSVMEPVVAAVGIKLLVYSGEATSSLQELSSSDIRRAIATLSWDGLRERDWLPPRVLERLRSMGAPS